MAESKSVLDRYDQTAALTVASTAAAAGTVVTQLVTGIANTQKVAWAVSEIEWHFAQGILQRMDAVNGRVMLFLTASASIAQETNPTNASLYDMCAFEEQATPAALGGPFINELPRRHVFSPGHELLLLPFMIFAGIRWSTTAMAAYFNYIRLRYKEVELGPEDWYDLLQMRMPLGAV